MNSLLPMRDRLINNRAMGPAPLTRRSRHHPETAAGVALGPSSDSLGDDAPISLAAARLLPELALDGVPPSPASLYRWITPPGCRGVVLGTVRNRGRLGTSRALVREFITRLSYGKNADAAETSSDARRDHEQAESVLEAAGI